MVVLVFHQLRRTKACATSIFNFHRRCLWWRVEKPVPEARILHTGRHDTNTCATPDSRAAFPSCLSPSPLFHDPWVDLQPEGRRSESKMCCSAGPLEQHEAAVGGHATRGISTAQDSAWSFCVNPSWLSQRTLQHRVNRRHMFSPQDPLAGGNLRQRAHTQNTHTHLEEHAVFGARLARLTKASHLWAGRFFHQQASRRIARPGLGQEQCRNQRFFAGTWLAVTTCAPETSTSFENNQKWCPDTWTVSPEPGFIATRQLTGSRTHMLEPRETGWTIRSSSSPSPARNPFPPPPPSPRQLPIDGREGHDGMYHIQ